jgi:D-alanyl-D-alanine carboxypeptidase/D-alanyl-D-alanine-endopeptidase (penicillin-binding protein 4)
VRVSPRGIALAVPVVVATCLASACLQAKMRRVLLCGVLAGVLVAIGTMAAVAAADAALRAALSGQLAPAGPRAAARVVDLADGRVLFSRRADRALTPASNQKIYTTGTALLRFGANGRLRTTALAASPPDDAGVLHGFLYLRGGGDPTFGSASYVANNYGTGAAVEDLAQRLSDAGLTRVEGSVIGDESFFDRARGTAPYGFARAGDIEGQLSGLAFNRGFTDGGAFQSDPSLFAARKLTSALRSAGVTVTSAARTAGTPAGAQELAHVDSPTMATLARLTNRPSDNYFAETLIKDLGARFGGAGSTAAGARVVRATLARYGARPTVVDGSGLSYTDHTTARHFVSFLAALRRSGAGGAFDQSLAGACRSGTLGGRMCGTTASGRCRGKTGTLPAVSALSGYCTARNGHTVAFSILMNGVNVARARFRQDNMVAAIARYRGG